MILKTAFWKSLLFKEQNTKWEPKLNYNNGVIRGINPLEYVLIHMQTMQKNG